MKTEKSKRLKGAVLFTVVSVMSLLIIFLMGTLLLASAANKRAQKSYAVSQAEYTAKTAIESFTKAMESSEEIAGAVQGLNSAIYPEIIINEGAGTKTYADSSSYSGDGTLGKVGCYKNNTFLPNHIAVEPVPNSEKYYYDEIEGWVELVTVRISATVQLAGEEKTVSAYIRKRAPHEISESEIKGLQTAGGANLPNGGTYTGGLGVGLENDTPQISTPYSITNDTTIETNLTFINGSLNAATSSLKINVLDADSETAIMGNLWLKNNEFINVDYTMKGQYTQKDIPYLYVDGGVAFASSPKFVEGNRGPYNIFMGTIDSWGKAVSFNAADIYLMDSVDGGTYNVIGEGQTVNVTKGKNRIGGTSSSSLSSWISSVTEKTETQFSSSGGNIYCNGDLYLSDIIVNGDVYVERDAYIGKDVVIKGNLYVGSKLVFTEGTEAENIGTGKPESVKGNIYVRKDANGNINVNKNSQYDSGIKLKDKYKYTDENGQEVTAEYVLEHNHYHMGLKPGYVQIPVVEYENEPVPDDWGYVDNKKIENRKYENKIYKPVTYENTPMPEEEQAKYEPVPGTYDENDKKYKYEGWWQTFDEEMVVYRKDEGYGNYTYAYGKEDGLYYKTDYNGNPTQDPICGPTVSYAVDKDGNAKEEFANRDLYVYKAKNDGSYDNQPYWDINYQDEYVIYKVDKNGNVTMDEVQEEYYYLKVDASGNVTDEIVEFDQSVYDTDLYFERNYQGKFIDKNDNELLDTDDISKRKTTNISTIKYKVVCEIENGKIKLDDEGKPVCMPKNEATTDDYCFFKEDGTPVEKNVAYGEYYTKADDDSVIVDADKATVYYLIETSSNGTVTKTEITEAEATEPAKGKEIFELNANVDIYPSSMTRDAILGYVRDANGNITSEIDDSNKIVERIEEVRKSLGYDATQGFDSSKYTDHVPDGIDASLQAFTDPNNNNINKAVCDIAGNINKSCTISGSIPQHKIIKIKPTSEIWIVLENVTVEASEIIIDESGGGKVNFLIKETLSLSNGKIRTKKIKEGVIVRASDNMNVTIYGEQNSAIVMTNNSLVCGAAKAPYTKLTQKCMGPIMIQYVDEYGNMSQKNPAWIGNALVKEVVEAENEFGLCYTKAGSSSPNYIDTEVGLWEINYFEQY